jgi:putative hydrolase of the HAD superfamily
MTTAIFFDLDGTLVTYEESSEAILTTTFESAVGRAEPAWLDHYDERFFEHFEAFATDPYERAMADVVAEFELDADPASLVDALAETERRETTVSEQAIESLRQLGVDNRLGVLTDGVRDWQLAKLDQHGVRGYFHAVVTSYEVGAHKPDEAMFAAVREAIEADEYVMVGDDYERDVEGARAAGFVPIHFEREGPDFWGTLNAMV